MVIVPQCKERLLVNFPCAVKTMRARITRPCSAADEVFLSRHKSEAELSRVLR